MQEKKNGKVSNSNADDASVKLNFSDGSEDSALFFELEAQKKKKEQRKEKETVQQDPSKEEFALPNKYTINKRHNTSRMIVDESPSVRATYMPKFTDVSLNYRITEEKRPRRKFNAKRIDSNETGSLSNADAIDPTTEALDVGHVSDVKVVDTSVPSKSEKTEFRSTIYKFSGSQPVSEPKKIEPVEEAKIEPTVDFVILSDESSADAVFANGDINYSVMVKASAVEERNSVDEEFASLQEESKKTESEIVEPVAENVAAEKEIKPTAVEYKLPDPEPIVIDVPEVNEITLVGHNAGVTFSDTPDNIGDVMSSNEKGFANEYTSFSQRDSFKDKFLDVIMSVKVRLAFSFLILLVALVVENISAFGIDMPSVMGMSGMRSAMAILDIQIVVCLFLLSLPETIGAFHKLFLGRVIPELFVPVSFAVLVLYYVSIIMLTPLKYPLFGLVFAVFSVGAILATLFRTSADFSNFKTVSRNSAKKIVDRKLTRTLPEESFAVDGKVEGYKSKTARVFRATFVSDFFKRSGKCSENSSNVALMLALAFGIAFVGGAVAYFIPGGLVASIKTFVTIFMLGIPAFVVLSHKLPYYHSSIEAMYENSAVIGESTLYDYSGVDVITFSDTEIFGTDDIKLQRIMLYGKNENLPKAMQQMTAIFSVVGGPLENMFASSIEQYTTYAVNVVIEDDGVFGDVMGAEVRAGSYEYMKRHGVLLPEESAKENQYTSTKIMYAAENGVVYAKFYIRYALSEEFMMLLPSLCDEGVTPLLYTRDPNINADLLRILTAGTDTIRVLKKQTLNSYEEKVYHRVSAGMVTLGDKTNIVNMLLMSKKYVRFQSRMTTTEVTAMIVGCVLAALISFGNMLEVPSILLALWQVAWCFALYFMSRRALRTARRNRKTGNFD